MGFTALTPDEVYRIVNSTIDHIYPGLRQLNQEIHTHPEVAFTEHHAHDTICTFLESHTHKVTRHAYGLTTAFEAISRATTTTPNPITINFNAEYDALPDIGHACGHNLIATSSVVAFLALSAILANQPDANGQVQLLGTPAEENGGGKALLLRAGAYNGVAVSLMGHGGPTSMGPGIAGVPMTARQQLTVTFNGESAHAGATPWEGRNALDALVAAYMNVSNLRQHIRPEERIHCAILDTPTVANVIPARTKACWQARSASRAGLEALVGKVRRCVEAGALATGCEVDIFAEEAYDDVVLNETLGERYVVHMARYGREVRLRTEEVLSRSADAGNVSYVVPTLHSFFSIQAPDGCTPHHSSYTEAAGTNVAHDEAIRVGKALAFVGWDMISNPELLLQAQTQWRGAISGKVGSV